MDEHHLELLRRAEVEMVKSWFQSGMRVLEIGGGTGFQAAIIASWGCEVTSIDIDGPTPGKTLQYPVQRYDGKSLPFPNHRFDIVFSSNVLEHVQDVGRLLSESRRVLSEQGMAIHILPSPYLRIWTSLAHYVYVALRVVGKARPLSSGMVPSLAEKAQQKGIWYVVSRGLVAGPHGEYPSAVHELYAFSQRRWIRMFRENGFEMIHCSGNGLFYTGYGVLPRLSLTFRRLMGRVLGSSARIYVMQVTR